MKAFIKTVVVLLMLFQAGCNNIQTQKNDIEQTKLFKQNDKIVFVGNSITKMGMFHHDLLLYHITRFPEQPIKMYNCGVGGDVTQDVLNRLQTDILSNNPTVAVIMLGMNDMSLSQYSRESAGTEEIKKLENSAFAKYRKKYEILINEFLSREIRVILERPSIYDQTAAFTSRNLYGKNDALGRCALFVDSIAQKYNLPVVDYYSEMNRITSEIQAKDSMATIVGKDRTHPGEVGHLIMAYQFLKADNAPQFVSKIVVDAEKRSISEETFNCQIDDISNTDNEIKFTVKEFSLPFPVIDLQKDALSLVPFMDDFNFELFKINNLPKGKYQLKIDNITVDEFSSAQLSEGVNLAEYQSTPQYRQAIKIRNELDDFWELERRDRSIHFCEKLPDYKNCPVKDNFEALIKYLDSSFTANYTNPYFRDVIETYSSSKPKEKEIKEKMERIRDDIYDFAKPEEHLFELIKLAE